MKSLHSAFTQSFHTSKLGEIAEFFTVKRKNSVQIKTTHLSLCHVSKDERSNAIELSF